MELLALVAFFVSAFVAAVVALMVFLFFVGYGVTSIFGRTKK